MVRVVGQVVRRTGRIDVLWHAGEAAFEPYSLAGEALSAWDAAIAAGQRAVAEVVAGRAGEASLAPAGQELFRLLFSSDVGAEVAQWLRGLAARNEIDTLELQSDAPGDVPFAIVDDPSQPGPFGKRFRFAQGSRSNPLRTFSELATQEALLVVDPRAGWSDAERAALAELRAEPVDSRAALVARVRERSPDVLFLLGRGASDGWSIGSDTVTPSELARAFAQCAEGNATPVVFAVAVGSDAPFLSAAARALPGLIANRAGASPATATAWVRALTDAIMTQRLPLGQAMSAVRKSHASALGVAVFAPAHVRFLAPDETPTPEAHRRPLPPTPFVPLRPLEREERCLLVAREDDVARASTLLDDPNACGVLVVGKAGTGKASLVRAGIIPYLEEDSVGFLALRDRSVSSGGRENEAPTLALRTGPDPAGTLLQGLASFCVRAFEFSTPTGRTVSVDLPRILADSVSSFDAPSLDTLWQRAQTDPAFPAQLLDRVSRPLPFELVVAFEQGEDAVGRTLKGRIDPIGFFASLARCEARAKLVVTLRTEKAAEFSGLLGDDAARSRWKTHFLPELSAAALETVLQNASSPQRLLYATETPAKAYQFAFRADAVREAVRSARETIGRYTELQLVQAIGALAFDRCKTGGRTEVEAAETRELAAKPFENYLKERIRKLPIAASSQQALETLYRRLVQTDTGVPLRRLASPSKLKGDWAGADAFEAVVNVASESGPLLELQSVVVGGKEEMSITTPADAFAAFGAGQVQAAATPRSSWRNFFDMALIVVPAMFLAASLTYFLIKRVQARSTGGGGQIDVEKVKQIADEANQARVEARANRFPAYVGALGQAEAALARGQVLHARQKLLAFQPIKGAGDIRGFEWHYLWRRINAEEKTLKPHAAPVRVAALSPDGAHVATADETGVVRVAEAKRPEEAIALLVGLRGPVLGVAFSADGKRVAALDGGDDVPVWSLEKLPKDNLSLAPEKRLAEKGARALAFVDGMLVVAGEKRLAWWDVAGAAEKAKVDGSVVALVAFGKEVVALDGKNATRYDAAGAKQASTKAPGATLAISGPAGSVWLAADRSLLTWDGKDGAAPTAFAKLSASPAALAPLGGGRIAVALASDARVQVFTPDGKAAGHLVGHLSDVRSVTAVGERVVTASYDNSVKFWDAKTALAPEAIPAHDRVTAVAIDASEKLLATAGADGLVKLWDPADGALRQTLKAGGPVAALAFGGERPATLAVAVGTEIKRWEVTLDKEKAAVKDLASLQKHTGDVTCLSYAPSGKVLVSGGADGIIAVWDADGKLTRLLPARAAVTSVFAGPLILSGDAEGLVRFWKIEDGAPFMPPYLAHGGAVTSVALLDLGGGVKGGFVSAGGDGSVRLWALEEHKGMVVTKAYSAHRQPISGLAQGNGYLASAALDGTVNLLDISLPDERFSFANEGGPVRAIAIGRTLGLIASGGDDGALRLRRAIPRPMYGPVNFAARNGGEVIDEEP